MVATMKTFIGSFTVALALLSQPLPGAAQVSYGAQAYAEQQQAEERWRKLSAQMEELLSTQEVLRKRISALEDENRGLRADVSRAASAGVAPEEFQRVIKEITGKLKEVDDKRVSDNKALLEQVKQLIKDIKPGATVTSPRVQSVPDGSEPLPSNQEYVHIVQSGENITAIVQGYQAQGIKTSIKAVQQANPGVNPNKLKVGQELIIPKLK